MVIAPETCVFVLIARGFAPFLDEKGGLKVAPMARPMSEIDLEWIRAHREKIIEGLRSPNVDYEVQLAWPSDENDLLNECFARVDGMGCTGMERFMKGWALAWGDPDPERGWPKDDVQNGEING